MSDATNFGKMVPGFDFLQSLMKNAGSAVPGMGQWIAPTLDPAELEKRISELRTVHFWLEQNARMLGATIQALEVQRMTLATLQSMNLPVTEMAEAFKLRMPSAPASAPAPAPAARPAPTPAPAAEAAPLAAPTGVVDPLQWWGALTKQFSELAAGAMKDGPGDIARNMAKSVADTVASSVASTVAASAAPKKATAEAAGAAKPAARKRAS